METTNDQRMQMLLSLLQEEIDAKDKGDFFLGTERNLELLIINGNRGGMLRLAKLALQLANKETPGSNFTFDEAGELEACEQPFKLVYKPAGWELN